MRNSVILFLLAGSAWGQQVFRYKQGDPSAYQEYVNGNLYRTIHANGITVGVMFSEAPKAFRASVAVFVDEGALPHDILPQNITLSIIEPRQKELRPKNPAKIIASINRTERWASAFDQMGANMQTQQATTRSSTNGQVDVSDNRGTTATGTYNSNTASVTTVPDYEARRAAAMRTASRHIEASSAADYVNQAALRANTVKPGQSVDGIVWFDKDGLLKKKGTAMVIRVPVDDMVFEFPMKR